MTAQAACPTRDLMVEARRVYAACVDLAVAPSRTMGENKPILRDAVKTPLLR
jgi:hypothetical protein